MKRKDYECPECGEPCDAKECDAGIGPVEFWGAKSFDSRPYMGSDCCEADLEDVETSFEDEGDYRYDCIKDERAEVTL